MYDKQKEDIRFIELYGKDIEKIFEIMQANSKAFNLKVGDNMLKKLAEFLQVYVIFANMEK